MRADKATVLAKAKSVIEAQALIGVQRAEFVFRMNELSTYYDLVHPEEFDDQEYDPEDPEELYREASKQAEVKAADKLLEQRSAELTPILMPAIAKLVAGMSVTQFLTFLYEVKATDVAGVGVDAGELARYVYPSK